MKRLAIAVSLLAIGAAGCGSSTTPTNPSTFKVFTVQLFPNNEVPPVTNAEQSGRGTAVITIHSDTNTVDFSFSLKLPQGVYSVHVEPGSYSTAAGVNLLGVSYESITRIGFCRRGCMAVRARVAASIAST